MHFSIIYLCHDGTSGTYLNLLALLIWVLCRRITKQASLLPDTAFSGTFYVGLLEDAAVPSHLPALRGAKAAGATLVLLNIVHSV